MNYVDEFVVPVPTKKLAAYFSWIVYKSRKQRDAVNKKAMADPRLAAMMDPKKMPFDGKRMFFGGFRAFIDT